MEIAIDRCFGKITFASTRTRNKSEMTIRHGADRPLAQHTLLSWSRSACRSTGPLSAYWVRTPARANPPIFRSSPLSPHFGYWGRFRHLLEPEELERNPKQWSLRQSRNRAAGDSAARERDQLSQSSIVCYPPSPQLSPNNSVELSATLPKPAKAFAMIAPPSLSTVEQQTGVQSLFMWTVRWRLGKA